MNPNQAVCNYALLRFLPNPDTGEFVNVGVLVTCSKPCYLHFLAEEMMPDRAKALFPDYNPAAFEAAVAAMGKEVKRISGRVRGPKDCQLAFNELVRPRESTLRYGDVKTILSDDAQNVPEVLFQRYFRREAPAPQTATSQG